MLWSIPAFGQAIPDRARIALLRPFLDSRPGDQPLVCEVKPVEPSLGFGFRFRAGYHFQVPLNQYSGAGHNWTVFTEVTPLGGARDPVYFVDVLKLPPIPGTDATGDQGGGYLLGEGSYRVRWALIDDRRRVCRKGWDIDVKLRRDEGGAKVAMRPFTVAESSLRGIFSASPPSDAGPPLRLSILLDAAPMYPGRVVRNVLRGNDSIFLIGALAALLERVPASSVRVVLFNLEQQRELFHRDGFTRESLDDMARSLNDLQLATVDYQALQTRPGDFVAGLINRELRAAPLSDAVIILGPQERYREKLPANALERINGAMPQFFFLKYPALQPVNLRPSLQRRRDAPVCGETRGLDMGSADSERTFRGGGDPCARWDPGLSEALSYEEDTIGLAVKSLKGKVIPIQSPGEFAKAIQQLERRVIPASAQPVSRNK
jgi:hypothetical protein